jgi:hypothetical protein
LLAGENAGEGCPDRPIQVSGLERLIHRANRLHFDMVFELVEYKLPLGIACANQKQAGENLSTPYESGFFNEKDIDLSLHYTLQAIGRGRRAPALCRLGNRPGAAGAGAMC